MIALHILGAACLVFALALMLSIQFGVLSDCLDEWSYVKESVLFEETIRKARNKCITVAVNMAVSCAGIIWLVCVLYTAIKSGALT